MQTISSVPLNICDQVLAKVYRIAIDVDKETYRGKIIYNHISRDKFLLHIYFPDNPHLLVFFKAKWLMKVSLLAQKNRKEAVEELKDVI